MIIEIAEKSININYKYFIYTIALLNNFIYLCNSN